MVIQGTQVPMYTNTHCCIFLIFQFLFYFIYFYEKQNKAKMKTNKQKHVK